MSHLTYGLAFNRSPDLVVQDYRVNTLSTLHAAKGLYVGFIGVMQLMIPLGHEQARTTSTTLSRELLARGKRPNGISTSLLFYRYATL
ncbi:MAG: hypothetical protein ABI988_06320 [Nitrospirota bacterium]